MIVILLVLSLLQTGMQGSPLPPSTYSKICNNSIRDDSASGIGGGDSRTAYGIVWSCLVTIAACVWSAGHPNISGPTDSGWTVLKRRIIAMVYVLIVPELMACWALRQYIAAKKIAGDYNMTFLDAEEDSVYIPPSRRGLDLLKNSLCGGMKEWFAEQPRSASRRGKGLRWTQTHGFFVQMGGFLLYKEEYPLRVLGYDDMKELIKTNKIDAPIVAATDLKDRSKGDAISKGFVVLQTTWFAVQCLARLSKHLPLAEVEVVTLAFTVLNAIIYVLWWNKPQGVGAPIFIALESKSNFQRNNEPTSVKINSSVDKSVDETGVQVEMTSNSASKQHLSGGPDVQTPDLINLSKPNIPVDEENHQHLKERWLQHQLTKDRSKFNWLPYIFVRVPWRCIQCLVRPLQKLCGNGEIPTGALRVPIFYEDSGGSFKVWGFACIIGTGFGAIHLLAWNSKFPTQEEHLLWLISALIITIGPALTFVGSIFREFHSNFGDSRLFKGTSPLFTFMVIPLYILGRFSLIILAVLALRDQPQQVYIPVPWTSIIPHF